MNDASAESATPPSKLGPDMLDRLFVLEQQDEAWIFRNAGDQLADLIGRVLTDHDFLNLWTGFDRDMVNSLLGLVTECRQPGFCKARGETLVGRRVEIEFTLAPLLPSPGRHNQARMIGLYQTLTPIQRLNGRPVWRHRLTEITPPDVTLPEPGLRLVANND